MKEANKQRWRIIWTHESPTFIPLNKETAESFQATYPHLKYYEEGDPKRLK